MRFAKKLLPLGILPLILFLLAACGSTGTTTSSYGSSGTAATATTAPTATPTSLSDTGKDYTKGKATPGATNTTTVKTASVTVKGKAETVLTTAQGMTLYYFTPDTATTTACTGGCASNWPPLLTTGSSAPTGATAMGGKLTAQANANGTQVQYNGHFLYTFAGDSATGQANGEGVGGKWFVATANMM